jgi:hypothetical protein
MGPNGEKGKRLKSYFPTDLESNEEGRTIKAHREQGCQVLDLSEIPEKDRPRPSEILQYMVARGTRAEDIKGLQNGRRGKYFLFAKENVPLYPNGSFLEVKGKKVKIGAPPPFTRMLGDRYIEVH